jgi:tetratricopeptide (TPR) repeat protein
MRRLALLLSALPLLADDVILLDGSVIQGKIDSAATNSANRGKTNPADAVLVIQTSEQGERRTLKHAQVKAVMAKKPPWEIRRENLEWFEKNKAKQKDTIQGQEQWGRQCRSRGLEEQATAALRRALELRRALVGEKNRDPVQDRIALAQWCRKNGLIDEEREELKTALALRREKAGSEPPKLAEAGAWAKSQGLVEEALSLYEEALKLDPDCSAARAGAKEIRESAQYRMRDLVAQYVSEGRAWKIKVAIEDAASPQVMQEWKELLERLSDFIFEVTEGQFFVREWTLEDQSSNGQIIVDRGKLTWQSMQGASAAGTLAYCVGPGTPGWRVHCPGKTWEAVLCHEMFHGIFGVLDEYYQNPMCPCIMRASPNPQKLCNPSNHVGGGMQKEACWETIRRRFKSVTSPNPAWTYTKQGIKGRGPTPAEEVDGELDLKGFKISRAPECRVIVVDK